MSTRKGAEQQELREWEREQVPWPMASTHLLHASVSQSVTYSWCHKDATPLRRIQKIISPSEGNKICRRRHEHKNAAIETLVVEKHAY